MSPISAKTYTTEVICLRAIEFGEADKILHLYSPEHGKISAIAKGVKKPKSRLAGACELLSLSEVQLAKGKNLDVLCQYQPKDTFTGIRSDLLKVAYGILFAEMVNVNAADVDSHTIFALLKDALTMLDQADEPEVMSLAIDFQIALVHSAGYHPVMTECAISGQPLDMSLMYYCFSPDLGGITTPDLKRRQQIQTGGPGTEWVNVSTSTLKVLSAPYERHWTPTQLYKAQKFLQYYLRHIFEKNLHAYQLVFNLLEMALPAIDREESPVSQPA